jgi:hypothetical protein
VALRNLVGAVRGTRSATRNATRNALRIAACESRLGFYPWRTAVDEFKPAAVDSYTARGESFEVHLGEYEFSRLVANGVGWASSRAITEIDAEANREYGSRHDVPLPIGAGGFQPAYRSAYRPAFAYPFRRAFAPSVSSGIR